VKLLHVGIVCSSEENADKFYAGLLGLEKMVPKELPAQTANAIFGIASPMKMINYLGNAVRIEIFVGAGGPAKQGHVDHVCFEIEEIEAFLQKCREENIEIIQVPRNDYTVTFIKDFDGNLFEIKGKS